MSRVLVAGIGNIFRGDDGFGVAVAQFLMSGILPANIDVVDFGIRGTDLTYALMDDYDLVLLVDAAIRGGAPGTLSLVEPDTSAGEAQEEPWSPLSAHDLDPANTLHLVNTLGRQSRRILLLACEPLDCGGEQGRMGLSDVVAAAVTPAATIITDLLSSYQPVDLQHSHSWQMGEER